MVLPVALKKSKTKKTPRSFGMRGLRFLVTIYALPALPPKKKQLKAKHENLVR